MQYKNSDKCHDNRHAVIFLTLNMNGLCQGRLDGSLASSMGSDVLPFCRSGSIMKLIELNKCIDKFIEHH